MGEEQAVDGDDLYEALFVAAVALGVVAVDDGDLLPGQRVELAGLPALVVLDGQQVVGAAFVQVGGVVALGVEGIGGDDGPGEIGVVDLVEQGCELGYFVGLRADLAGGQGDAVAVPDGGEYEDLTAVRAFRAAQAFAVHRDGPAPGAHRFGAGGRLVGTALFPLDATVGHERSRRAGPGGEQRPQMVVAGGADLAGIQAPQDGAQRLLARDPVPAEQRVEGQAEGGQFLGCRAPAPLRCRGDGVMARRGHRADHQGQQRRDSIPHPACPARIGDRLELGYQAADLVPRVTRAEGFQAGCRRGRSSGSG